jgi:hypothetical protein
MDRAVRVSRLAVLALVLALSPFLAFLAVVLAAVVAPECFSPPAGNSSVLVGQSAWLVWLVGLWFLFLLPAALVVGIISLVRISRSEPRTRGSAYAWAAIAISGMSGICCLCSNLAFMPLMLIPPSG